MEAPLAGSSVLLAGVVGFTVVVVVVGDIRVLTGGGAVRALEKVGLVRVAPVVVRGVKETPVLRAFCCYRRPCNSFYTRQASWKQRLTVVYSL